MASVTLRNDEIVGLGVAVILHVGLLAVLLMKPEPLEVPKPPPRMVSLPSCPMVMTAPLGNVA